MFIINEDYLPDGWTVERLEKAVMDKATTNRPIDEVVDMDKLNEEIKEIDKRILKSFSRYLKEKGEPTNITRSYANTIKRICEENNIFVCSLIINIKGFTINDLIGIYNLKGVKYEENIKKNNIPLNALKSFRDFIDLIRIIDEKANGK